MLQLSYIRTIDIFTLSVYIVNVIACLKSSHSSNARMSYSESCSQKTPAYHYYRRQKQSHRELFLLPSFSIAMQISVAKLLKYPAQQYLLQSSPVCNIIS